MALLTQKKCIINSKGEEEFLNIYTTKAEAVDTGKPCKIVKINVDDQIITGYIGCTDELDTLKASSKRVIIDGVEYTERKYMGVKSMNNYMSKTYPETYNTITEITEGMLPDTSDCIDMSSFFRSCVKLSSVPYTDTRNCQKFNALYEYCNEIKIAPQIDTSKGIQFGYMYRGCGSVTKVSEIDFASIASNNSELNNVYLEMMFHGCYSLRSITFNNLPIGTTEATLRTKCYIPNSVTEIIMNYREV